jgi:hypothetical protein
MTNKIHVTVRNSYRSVREFTGDEEWSNGTSTIELETVTDGNVSLYIQNKGFGASSSKSVRTSIDEQGVVELIAFLQEHLRQAENLKKINEILGEAKKEVQ